MVLTIIVTYNGIKWLDKTIGSLISSSIMSDILVVDNNSTDETVSYIKTQFPTIILLEQTKNLGFGQANNIGLKYAIENGYKHVLLLNQDASLEKNTIANLLRYADEKTLLSPIHLNGKGEALDYNFKHSALELGGWENLLDTNGLLSVQEGKFHTHFINAACWLLPIEIVQTIGGFNPLFYHYSEDNNYIDRLHFHHLSVCFVAGSYIYHDRENRKPQPIDYNKIYRDLLLIQTNINTPLYLLPFKRFRYLLGLIHTILRTGKAEPLTLYKEAKEAIKKSKEQIIQSRFKEKTKGLNWLD